MAVTQKPSQIRAARKKLRAVTSARRSIFYFMRAILIVLAGLLVLDRRALKQVDYPLLMTFVFFFVFAGNMARIPAVGSFFGGMLRKNTLVYSAFSCQLISNVPSAILLSQFTENYPALLIGVNIGGTGTLIASLASLITFREYCRHEPRKKLKYIPSFSAFNFGFLGVLLAFVMLTHIV